MKKELLMGAVILSLILTVSVISVAQWTALQEGEISPFTDYSEELQEVTSEKIICQSESIKEKEKIKIQTGLDLNDNLRLHFSEVPEDAVYVLELYKEENNNLIKKARRDGYATNEEVIIDRSLLPEFDILNVKLVGKEENMYKVLGTKTFSAKGLDFEARVPSSMNQRVRDLVNQRKKIRSLYVYSQQDSDTLSVIESEKNKYDSSLTQFIESLKSYGECDVINTFKALLESIDQEQNNVAFDIINYVNEKPILLVEDISINTEKYADYLFSISYPLQLTDLIMNKLYNKVDPQSINYGPVGIKQKYLLQKAANDVTCTDYTNQIDLYLKDLSDTRLLFQPPGSNVFEADEEFLSAVEGVGLSLASAPATPEKQKEVIGTLNSFLSQPVSQKVKETVIESLGRIGTNDALDTLIYYHTTTLVKDAQLTKKIEQSLIEAGNLNKLLEAYEKDYPSYNKGFDKRIEEVTKQCDIEKINAALDGLLKEQFSTKRILLKIITDGLKNCIDRIKNTQIPVLETLKKLTGIEEISQAAVELLALVNTDASKTLLQNLLADQNVNDGLKERINDAVVIVEGKNLLTNILQKSETDCSLQKLDLDDNTALLSFVANHKMLLSQYKSSTSSQGYDQLASLEDDYTQQVLDRDACFKEKIMKTLEKYPKEGLLLLLQLKLAGNKLTTQEITSLWPRLDSREKKRVLEIYPIIKMQQLTKEELMKLLEK